MDDDMIDEVASEIIGEPVQSIRMGPWRHLVGGPPSPRFVPLRGRIIIRPTGSAHGYADQLRKLGLDAPDTYEDDPRSRRNQNSLGRGIVVAMGPPALGKDGREKVPGFQVGDEVLHIGQHKSRDVMWNGEECRACSQEEVCAVLEEDDAISLADTDPPPEFGTEGMSE